MHPKVGRLDGHSSTIRTVRNRYEYWIYQGINFKVELPWLCLGSCAPHV